MTIREAVQRKCAALSYQESDALFFPGPGGKVNKARNFCSDCPFNAQCLLDAIDGDLDGFYAGSTKDERNEMKKFRNGVMMELTVFIDSLLPKKPEPGRRIKKREVLPSPHAWLDEVEPTEEELLLLA